MVSVSKSALANRVFAAIFALLLVVADGRSVVALQPLPSDVSACEGSWCGYFQPRDGETKVSNVVVHITLHGNAMTFSMATAVNSPQLPINPTECKVSIPTPPWIAEIVVPGLGKLDAQVRGRDQSHLVFKVDGPNPGELSLFRRDVKDINHPGFYQLDGPRGYAQERDLTMKWGDGRLTGKLFLPKGEGPFPVIVISPGGPESFALKDRLYDLLYASTLCSSGVAVTAFDDPGSGGSTGDKRKISLSESKEQLLAWADLIRSQKNIRADKVGYMGISEGSMVAAKAASEDTRTCCLLYVSGPHGLGWLMCRYWQINLSLLLGDDPTQDEPPPGKLLVALARRAAIDTSSSPDAAVNEAMESMRTSGLKPNATDSEVRTRLVAAYLQFRGEVRGSSWFMQEPDDLIAAVGHRRVPVLVIAGTRDERLPIRITEHTKRVLSSLDAVHFFFPEATHSLTDYGSPLSDNPYDPCQLISPSVLKVVSEFVVASTAQSARPESEIADREGVKAPTSRPFASLVFSKQRYSGVDGRFSLHVKIDAKSDRHDLTVFALNGQFAMVSRDEKGNVWRYADSNYLIQPSTKAPGTLDAVANPKARLMLTTSDDGKNVFDYHALGGDLGPQVEVDFNRVLDALRKSVATATEDPRGTFHVLSAHGSNFVLKTRELPDSTMRIESWDMQVPDLWHVAFDNISESELPYSRFITLDNLREAGLKVNLIDIVTAEHSINISAVDALKDKENFALAQRLSDLLKGH